MTPHLASQMRMAFASMDWNTGSKLFERAADDAQHLGSSRSAAPALRSAPRPRLHLLEQPHVLDRDDRLIGEGGDELDLLFREGFDTSGAASR